MKMALRTFFLAVAVGALAGSAHADSDTDTVNLFRGIDRSAKLLEGCYAYAIFPNIGKVGFIVGGARGEGHVYSQGDRIGETVMNQLSVGFQLGAQDYSEIIFFKDESALNNFTSGSFEFGADAGVTAVTASASGSAGTSGVKGSASGGMHDAVTSGGYYKGMAVFTLAKGGLMFEATLAGQKFSYTPLGN